MNILVSACLLGVNCKYSGGNNYIEKIKKLINSYTVIPICPEQLGGLRTPRSPAEIENNSDMDNRRVITNDGQDVTKQYEKGAEETLKLARLYNCEYAILKERSPSCGHGKIYDGTFSKTLIDGNGKTADLLINNGIQVFGETEIDKLLSILKS